MYVCMYVCECVCSDTLSTCSSHKLYSMRVHKLGKDRQHSLRVNSYLCLQYYLHGWSASKMPWLLHSSTLLSGLHYVDLGNVLQAEVS